MNASLILLNLKINIGELQCFDWATRFPKSFAKLAENRLAHELHSSRVTRNRCSLFKLGVGIQMNSSEYPHSKRIYKTVFVAAVFVAAGMFCGFC